MTMILKKLESRWRIKGAKLLSRREAKMSATKWGVNGTFLLKF